MKLSDRQVKVMQLVREHGPLTYPEIAIGAHASTDEVDQAVREIERHGFVHVFNNHKVHLTALGRHRLGELS